MSAPAMSSSSRGGGVGLGAASNTKGASSATSGGASQAAASTLPRGSVAAVELGVGAAGAGGPSSSSSVSPSHHNNNHHHHSHPHTSFTTTTASFINHHANRLKSKLVPNTIMQSSSTLASGTSSKMLPNQQSGQWTSQKNTLIIMANAAAIELYFLCIEDESDAEKLCTKCSEKFFLSNMSLSETILQAPLIASCIQVRQFFVNNTSITN